MTDSGLTWDLVLAIISTLAGVVGTVVAIVQRRASRSNPSYPAPAHARTEQPLPAPTAERPVPTAHDQVERNALDLVPPGPPDLDQLSRRRTFWRPSILAFISGTLMAAVIVGQHAWQRREGATVLFGWLIGVVIVLISIAASPGTIVTYVAAKGFLDSIFADFS